MKLLAIAGLSILLILISIQIVTFLRQENTLSQTLAATSARLAKTQSDETNLSEEIQYLANPANLEKELRAQFNYKNPGETMLIIVPAQSSTASSSE
jgi:cell division protein FtsB